ncbi:MAG: dipeptide ABC transporter ATP-binding protein [Alphaproteobacteria bacterium]|nr:dipeptide ABC transporter ATP-binding protein [Alphaproteobacteria bacterium]
MKAAPLLRVDGLVKHFPVRRGLLGRTVGAIKAVDGIAFDLAAGETLAIVGESGCGKSTAGRLVLRLIEPTEGTVEFEGENIFALSDAEMRARRRHMQIIFQDPYASLNPRMTVGEMLGEPLRLHGIARGAEARDRVGELLQLVGLSPRHAQRFPHEFSGGQRQRIGIARALACNPRLIVGDEPVSALDVSIQAQIVNLLKDLQQRFKLGFILISHGLGVVRHVADRVAVMYLGKIVEIAEKHALFASPRHPYTQALLQAIPWPDPTLKRQRAILEGDVPSPLNPPAGCRFHTRCPYAQERCRREEPPLAGDGAHAIACHFWRDIAPPQLPVPSHGDASRARLDRLQAHFGAPRPSPSPAEATP